MKLKFRLMTMTMMTYRFDPAYDDEGDDDNNDNDNDDDEDGDDDDGEVPVWSSLLSGCFSETGRQSSPLRAEKHLVILDHHDNDHHDVIFDHQDYDDVIVDIDDHDYVIVDHHDHDDVILDHHDHDDNDGHDHDDSLDDGDSGDDDFDDQDDHKNDDDDDAKNVLNLKQRVEHSVLLDRVGMDTLHNNDYSENDSIYDSESDSNRDSNRDSNHDSNRDSNHDSNRDKLSLIMVTTTNVMILMRWCWDEPGMSRGWVGIDRLDLLVACQQIMMMVLLISRASMMITCTLSSTTCRWGTFPTPPAGTKEVMLIVMVVILMILVNMMVIEMIVVNIMLYSKHGNVLWISWFSKK